MKVKRLFAGLSVVLIATTVFLTGCGAKSQGNEGKNQQKTASSASTSTAGTENMVGNMYKEGLPIVKEKVTLNIAAKKRPAHTKNFAEMEVFKKLEERTNIHIDFEEIPDAQISEKISLMFSTRDLPDAFFVGLLNDSANKFGQQEMLIPLEGLIKEWAPNIQKILDTKPLVHKKAVDTFSGHIYSLPDVNEFSYNNAPGDLFINKVWLDKLGLPVPTTTDEFYQALKGFKSQDMDGNGKKDEIPFTFLHSTELYGIHALFGAFGIPENIKHMMVKDGKLVFTTITPEYKEAIGYFSKLYQEGLIDPESFTQNKQQIFAKGKASPIGAFIYFYADNVVGAEKMDEYAFIKSLKGPNGAEVLPLLDKTYNRGAFAISSTNKYPEITMRLFNELFDVDTAIEIGYGPLGRNIEKNADGTFTILPPPEGMSPDEFRFQEALENYYVPDGILKLADNDPIKQKIERFNQKQPYFVKDFLPNLLFSQEQMDELAVLEVDIFDYVKKTEARWIVDGTIDKEWDEYIKKLNDMGLERLLAIYNDAYQKYTSIK